MTTFLISIIVVLLLMTIIVARWIVKAMKEAREVQENIYCLDIANRVIHKVGCERIEKIPHQNRRYIEDYDGMLYNVMNCRRCGGIL